MEAEGSDPSSDISSTEAQLDVDEVIEELFPYESPYPDQREGIKTTIENFRNKGVTVLEGECGTGKTLISLISALGVIRDPTTQFERALVVTSVKQQQEAFEEDIEEINQAVVDRYGFARDAPPTYQPVTGLSLVGKGDLCAYTDTGAISHDRVSQQCSTLINNTNQEAARASVSGGDTKADGARDIVASAQSHVRESGEDHEDDYEAISNPQHPSEPIQFNGCQTCPYYAQHIVDDEEENDSIQYNWEMFDSETLRDKAAQLGTCPYMAMHEGISKAEVIIGNYAHIFHDTTVEAVTQSIINSNTLLIVDEAHGLTEKVRDYESEQVTRGELTTAIEEIDSLLSKMSTLDAEVKDSIEDEFRRYDTTKTEIEQFQSLINDLHQMVGRVVGSYSQSQTDPPYEDSIGFRDPEDLKQDRFDQWLEHIKYNEDLLDKARFCGKAVAKGLRIVAHSNNNDPKKSYNTEAVGRLLTKKFYAGQAEYFSEIEIEGKGDRGEWSFDNNEDVGDNYSMCINLHNCMPANEIKRKLMKFGAGLLMSATISPMDVYSDIVGVSDIEKPVQQKEFDLRFPEENRCSYIVGLDKFTSSNRGKVTDSNDVRTEYRQVLLDIIDNVEGNTLICMPSYKEAKWVEETISSVVNNPVYLDQSSTKKETVSLKRAFETCDDGVLVTSLRGTLTEGVDFSGDKLSNVVVVGVPLTYPYSKKAKAIQTAYAVEFGRKNAFDYSFSVPAVYKTRQAIGRVIRGSDEVGTRVLVDERYTKSHTQSVNQYLSTQQQKEFEVIEAENIGTKMSSFWMGNDIS